MTALDIRFLIPELKQGLQGSKVRKIYQYGTKAKHFILEFWKPGHGEVKLYVDKDRMFMTTKREAVPQEPPSFCMFLRKHLMGKTVKDVRQHGFDRIVEMEIADTCLVLELFKPGNVILLDSSRNIIMPLEVQRWKDREVKPKVPYKYPPAPTSPFEVDSGQLTRMMGRSEKKLGAFLAASLGFGPLYSKEICQRAGLDPERPAKDMGHQQVMMVFEVIVRLGRMEAEPCLCRGVVTPIRLQSCEPEKTFSTFSEALDEFYTELREEEKEREVEKAETEREEKIERIERQQKAAEEKWTKIAGESREEADLLYRNYTMVQAVLEGIRKAREQGMEWKELKERIKAEDTPEAEAIKEIREKDGTVVVEVQGKEIELDFRLSLEENAAKYYEESKWAKGKLGKLEGAREEVMKKIGAEAPGPKEEKPKPKKPRGRWFHKFKWFISSDGFLVVAGRSAAQNDTLLTKYAETQDWVYHADIPGAAFVVIRGEGKEVPDQTRKEAADFAAANSKAWSRGFGEVDVFCARRNRISKPGGMPKGSWVYSGEREWFRKLEVKLSVGVKVGEEAKVVYGPVMAVRNSSDYFVTIKPGDRPSLDLARTIKNKILIKSRPEHKPLIESIELTEFEKAIPGGTGDIVEYT